MPPSRLPKLDKPSSNKTNKLHSEMPGNFDFYPSFYLSPLALCPSGGPQHTPWRRKTPENDRLSTAFVNSFNDCALRPILDGADKGLRKTDPLPSFPGGLLFLPLSFMIFQICTFFNGGQDKTFFFCILSVISEVRSGAAAKRPLSRWAGFSTAYQEKSAKASVSRAPAQTSAEPASPWRPR